MSAEEMRMTPYMIVVLLIAAVAFLLGYLVRDCLGPVYVLTDNEILESLRTQLRAARAERDIAQWQEDGLLADVITELYRQLKDKKVQQTIKEDRHGRPSSASPKDRT
jgi:hypothetical protein